MDTVGSSAACRTLAVSRAERAAKHSSLLSLRNCSAPAEFRMRPEIGMALLSGVALAAVCGLRAFLPPLAVGLAARFGLLELDLRVAWLAGDPALVAFGFAAVLEIAADKVSVVDHALDLVAGVL